MINVYKNHFLYSRYYFNQLLKKTLSFQLKNFFNIDLYDF